jgi:hypothetical protein
MSETRTGPLVGKLVEGIQADIGDAVELLAAGLAKMRDLEVHVGGLNGIASRLRARSSDVQQVVDALRVERDEVAKKLLPKPPVEITERVNAVHLEAVRAAKGAA